MLPYFSHLSVVASCNDLNVVTKVTHHLNFLKRILGEGDHVIARAEYDFDGEGDDELSFRAGNILRLAPKGKQPRIRGWLLGTVDGNTEGIVPANYVKVSIHVCNASPLH